MASGSQSNGSVGEIESEFIDCIVNEALSVDKREFVEKDEIRYCEHYQCQLYEDDPEPERSNNASMRELPMIRVFSPEIEQKPVSDVYVEQSLNVQLVDGDTRDKTDGTPEVYYAADGDMDDRIYLLRRSRSDELLSIKHHMQVLQDTNDLETSPTCVSEIDGRELFEIDLQRDGYEVVRDEGSTVQVHEAPTRPKTRRGDNLPCVRTGEELEDEISDESDGNAEDDDDEEDDDGVLGGAQFRGIEEEYVERLAILEHRQCELEDVLMRLQSVLNTLSLCPAGSTVDKDNIDDEGRPEGSENPSTGDTESLRKLSEELFKDFQHKIRNFAMDLNGLYFIESAKMEGVLNCSEAALRHARVVQEWAIAVQRMFQQLKSDRYKMQDYIEERERILVNVKQQFLTELQRQSKNIEQIVVELKRHEELKSRAEKVALQRGDRWIRKPGSPTKEPVEERVVDLLLQRRNDEETAMALALAKQSKISEQKLVIVQQQSCIQKLQEENLELRAILEGLLGPDEYSEDEDNQEDPQGEKPEDSQEEKKQTKEKQHDRSPKICNISDVLYCDRQNYLPGNVTDGDLATIQTYRIGDGIFDAKSSDITFNPLNVDYINDQCKLPDLADEEEQELFREVDVVYVDDLEQDGNTNNNDDEENATTSAGDNKACADDNDVTGNENLNETDTVTSSSVKDESVSHVGIGHVSSSAPGEDVSTRDVEGDQVQSENDVVQNEITSSGDVRSHLNTSPNDIVSSTIGAEMAKTGELEEPVYSSGSENVDVELDLVGTTTSDTELENTSSSTEETRL